MLQPFEPVIRGGTARVGVAVMRLLEVRWREVVRAAVLPDGARGSCGPSHAAIHVRLGRGDTGLQAARRSC
jgi:hypothetical protein